MKAKKAKIERLTGGVDRRAGNTHEVVAPSGYELRATGSHTLICQSLAEAEAVQAEGLDKCGCDDCALDAEEAK